MKDLNKAFRDSEFEIRSMIESDGNAIIEGVAIRFNSEEDCGYFREKISTDALKETDFTDVALFVNHDTTKAPLARSRNNNPNSTLQIWIEEEVGLCFNAKLDVENNSESRNLYSSIKRGDISGMSFGFYVSDEEWKDVDTDRPLRIIRGISKITEISAVNNPFYQETVLEARGVDALDSVRQALDNAKVEAEKIELEKRSKELELEIEKGLALAKSIL